MSLNIYVAHTGEHLLADAVAFASLDALRPWIARHTSIPSPRQILMTAKGKTVKTQTLATESEIFVYDRRSISGPDSAEFSEIPLPPPLKPDNPPDNLADQNDLQAWRNLYKDRRSWALAVSERCKQAEQSIYDYGKRTEIISRAVGVALENLKALESRFQEAQLWANGLLKEQKAALDGWQQALAILETTPARKDFDFLRRPSTPKLDKDHSAGTLRDFVDVDEIQEAVSEVSTLHPRFSRQVQEIEADVAAVVSETQELVAAAAASASHAVSFAEGSEALLEEVEMIAKKVGSDYEHVLSLPNTPKSVANVARLAQSHTKTLLPSLLDMCSELQSALEAAAKRHSAEGREALRRVRAISSIESRLADAQARMASLRGHTDAVDAIFLAFHMPMVYGAVLIEAVRRREWSEKMKADSLTLAEEMAVFRDEEQRRRKKWMKTMGDFVSLPDSSTLAIEVNLQGQEYPWPEVSRTEAGAYIELLRANPGLSSVVEELSSLYKELDAPTRHQRRRAKAFKQGSVFDIRRSSLLLRGGAEGDEMVHSLREGMAKLEEKLKGSESRVRKLEDLLHRQSQMGRPLSGNFAFDYPISPASPHPDPLSRRSSVSSRRMSSNQPAEDRALVQRIVQLEAELNAERETVQRLQREAHTERQSTTDKLQEAQSTKRDLVENLEARQREFDAERKYLEVESKRLRVRVDELEEELDNAMDGREHDKGEAEAKLLQVETELQLAQRSLSDERQKVKILTDDYEAQKREHEQLQRQVSELHEAQTEHRRKDQETHQALQVVFSNLSQGGSVVVPARFAELIKAVEVLSEGLSIHARRAEESAASATAEARALEERLAQMERDAAESSKSSSERESQLARLQDELAQERLKLHDLQSQITAGQTGSNALQQRIAEGDRKLGDLAGSLAEAESSARRFEKECASWRHKCESLSRAEQQVVALVDARRERCAELSQLLYAQTEKLSYILDKLGFTIIRQDGKIAVERASKVNASSSTMGDSLAQSGNSMLVSLKVDPQLLNWTQEAAAAAATAAAAVAAADRPDEERARFAAFIQQLSDFDVEIFGEAIVKRVKDIELLARKWQKEARGYRDKYHRSQSEAHEKIAYRSFKEGDLALFLPTRNQAIRSWAAFNVGAPHYFLREQDAHKLSTRDWLLARITKVEERVVDLSRSLLNTATATAAGLNPDRRSVVSSSDGTTPLDDENPFELSDGLRWYLVDATEEKPGAPSTPGLGKSTVASAHVDAKGSIRLHRPANGGSNVVARTLTRSLDSRRNSSTSKKGVPPPALPNAESSSSSSAAAAAAAAGLVRPADADAGLQPREAAPIFDEDAAPPRLNHAASSASSASEASKRPVTRWEKVWSLDYRLESGSRRAAPT